MTDLIFPLLSFLSYHPYTLIPNIYTFFCDKPPFSVFSVCKLSMDQASPESVKQSKKKRHSVPLFLCAPGNHFYQHYLVSLRIKCFGFLSLFNCLNHLMQMLICLMTWTLCDWNKIPGKVLWEKSFISNTLSCFLKSLLNLSYQFNSCYSKKQLLLWFTLPFISKKRIQKMLVHWMKPNVTYMKFHCQNTVIIVLVCLISPDILFHSFSGASWDGDSL